MTETQKLDQLLILLPCHGFSDFPIYQKGEDAAALIASWTSLWHPLLLNHATKIPNWQRLDDPPSNCQGKLMVVPQCFFSQLQTGFAARAKEQGGLLIKGGDSRQEIVDRSLKFLETLNISATVGDESKAWVGHFFALGYCYLQVQLMTRHMRYSSNLDEVHFANITQSAAAAFAVADWSTVKERLQAGFDVLAEERDRFYPVDVHLLDLMIVPPTTMKVDWSNVSKQESAVNLLANTRGLKKLEQESPEVFNSIRDRIQNSKWELVGGEDRELRLPLLSVESIVRQLKKGNSEIEQIFGKRTKTFGRRRFGLTPILPQILQKLGYDSAFHISLDDGRQPEGIHIKTYWESLDTTVIPAFSRNAYDASQHETFLGLAVKIGEMLDSAHAAAMCFVHWPGQESCWMDDLRIVTQYCGALGRFVKASEYFAGASEPGLNDRFLPDQYRSPYLKQSIIRRQANPISGQVGYWKMMNTLGALNGMETLAGIVQPTLTSNETAERVELQLRADRSEESAEGGAETLDTIKQQTQNAFIKFAQSVPQKPSSTPSLFVANPHSFVRREGVVLPPNTPLPIIDKPVYSADRDEKGTYVVVDVPAMGYANVPLTGAKTKYKESEPKLAEEFLLRNEFFEATVDRTTGGLRTFSEYNVRGNRISQQLAFRFPTAGEESEEYSTMEADSIVTTIATRTLGEIQATGRLLGPDKTAVANFKQTFRVWRGTRVLSIAIELTPLVEIKGDGWSSYFASRFAYRQETLDIYRDLHQTRQSCGGRRLEAPNFIELEAEPKRTTILTGGIPFHRKGNTNTLDSILQVKGETATKFEMGIGIDVPYPLFTNIGLQSPLPYLADAKFVASPSPTSWLLHVDAKNAYVTNWELLRGSDNKPIGIRARILETIGRSTNVKLTGFRNFREANKLDLNGNKIDSLTLKDGQATAQLTGYELLTIEAIW